MIEKNPTEDALQKLVPFSRGPVEVFVGNAEFHRCFCALLNSARTEILDYVVPEQQSDEFDTEILAAYGSAIKRGISCRTLITASDLHLVQSTWEADFRLRSFLERFAHVRLVEKVRGPFTIIDQERVLLNLESPLAPGHYGVSVVLYDHRLASRLAGEFSQIWEQAGARQEDLLEKFERNVA